MTSLVIGIAGGTGSGKTTLTNALLERFAGRASAMYHDNYYRAHDDLDAEQRTTLNYDSPDEFDNDLMVEHLTRLVAGAPVDSPTYDFVHNNRAARTVRIEPKPIIIVEGILIFAEPRLCPLFDIRLFVDTDADVRLLRRIHRDVLERGRTLESVERRYLATVKPMHELYVEPSKRNAHIIIPEGGRNMVALDLLIHEIEHQLA
ncbi:uridine kinase [Brooklawnia cerclae]|uniref:Uridine kinase n=1 Tax=Brooklawnia cerclae TaxID=349934 RepID=A0ABX0SJ34_9ACTN|nr:uridine kinase [Brooklawnia cerclae]NIH58414.1 uridine kinase [Brooklawnia cerclae]